MDKSNLYLQLAIILLAFGYSQSLDCYVCSSHNNTDCSEVFDKENTKLQPTTCDIYDAKYCIKTTGLYEGKIGVLRFCSSRKFEDYCDYVKRVGDSRPLRSCVYACSSDGCNRGDKLSNVNLLLVFTSSIIFMAAYFK